MKHRVACQTADMAHHHIQHPPVRHHEHLSPFVECSDVGKRCVQAIGKLIQRLPTDEFRTRVTAQYLFEQHRIELRQFILRNALDRSKMSLPKAVVTTRRRKPQSSGDDGGRFMRSDERTRPHRRETTTGQRIRQSMRLLTPLRVDRNVQPALQDAVVVPVGFTVSGNAELSGFHAAQPGNTYWISVMVVRHLTGVSAPLHMPDHWDAADRHPNASKYIYKAN